MTTTTPLEIKISDEYEKLVPPLDEKRFDSLRDDIDKHGQFDPITVNEEGVILDGHHRYRINKELGRQTKYEIRKFENKLEEKKFVIKTNLMRRQLNDFQIIQMGMELHKIEAEYARQRQLAGRRITTPTTTLAPNDAKGKSAEKLAGQLGLSTRTVERGLTIIQKAPECLKEEMQRGKSINQGYQETLRLEDRDKPKPKPPEGRYDVILADPPWTYDLVLRGAPNEHYATMETEEIMNLNIPAADNAILFLWATGPKLREALDAIKAWGFEYKTLATWVKDKIGTGYYFRAKQELLLIGVRGQGIGVPAEADRPASVFHAPRQEHSKKPDIVYEMIERMYPGRQYIELFARGEPRDGWKIWGAEAL